MNLLGLVIGACIGAKIVLPLLIALIVGQMSVWRWLHNRYGVSWEEPFYQWLDRQLEKGEYFRKGWEDFSEALDEVGRGEER